MINFNITKWTKAQKLIGIIILAVLLCLFLQSKTIEKFIDGEFSKCPNKLYFDGGYYYLFNSTIPVSKKNPLVFSTLEEYNKNSPQECPKLKPIRKDTEPVLPLQWKCNRQGAQDDAKYNDCSNGIYSRTSKKECQEILQNSKADNHVNLSVERCMIDQVIKNDSNINPYRIK